MDAVTACWRFAGAVGVDPVGKTLSELWQMAYGRDVAVRQQAIWQATVLFAEKLDPVWFVQTGQVAGQVKKPALSAEQRKRVAILQGCWKRGLPEPDWNSPTWEDDVYAAFERHDTKQQEQQ